MATVTAMIGRSQWSMSGTEAPSAYPASTSPTAHSRPPSTCHVVKARAGRRLFLTLA
ncbi:hypothetical protein [Streptomyces sp. SR27]|uniref:hypothetical protein n=1 Tax=Streptomyces sp. SR27 TaxID=3076630 RepID=UPI003FA35EBA